MPERISTSISDSGTNALGQVSKPVLGDATLISLDTVRIGILIHKSLLQVGTLITSADFTDEKYTGTGANDPQPLGGGQWISREDRAAELGDDELSDENGKGNGPEVAVFKGMIEDRTRLSKPPGVEQVPELEHHIEREEDGKPLLSSMCCFLFDFTRLYIT